MITTLRKATMSVFAVDELVTGQETVLNFDGEDVEVVEAAVEEEEVVEDGGHHHQGGGTG